MCFEQKDVRMFLLSSVVFVVLLQSATGETYCSLNDTHIDCVPCYEKCVSRNQKCFLCPKQCGKSNNCRSVCKPTCLNHICEYVGDTVPVCTQGCIQGFTGKRCQEYCSKGCNECDQKTGKTCTSCMEGFECNITVVSSQTTEPTPSSGMRECSEECDFCKDDDVICEECTDETRCHPCGCNELRLTKQFPLTTTSAQDSMNTHPQTVEVTEASGYTKYVVGILSALCTGIAFVCYHGYLKKQLCFVQHRPCGRDRSTNYNNDGSSFTHTGYTYIDETNLGSCHDRRPINVTRCSGDNYYEEMGNRLSLADEDNRSESSVSASSGTLFGNLFEVDNESVTQSLLTNSEGQLNKNAIIDPVELYEMNCLNYITPTVTINANNGVSGV